MLDCLIKSAMVIDGTGTPARRADVGIRAGLIAALGNVEESAARVIDADGLMLTPGFVDPHTHYDAQLFWDPSASPSNLHGVTSVIGGNCGFTLAPLEPHDADYLRRMMAQVEGMPLETLEAGLPWDWRTFGEYLSRLDGRIGVNAGFMVGHSAIRRFAMGADAVGHKASPEQVNSMIATLHEALDAGGLGFSTSLSFTHMDGEGQPVPSRWCDRESELLPLIRTLREHEGTSIELITDGCVSRFTDDEVALMTRMSLEAQRPLNWNVLSISARERERYEHQLSASKRGAAEGARIVALTMPISAAQTMSFLSYCALQLIPGWKDILRLPVRDRIEALRKSETRTWMMQQVERPETGTLRRLAEWDGYTIGDTFADSNRGLKGRKVAEIARERGQSSTDCLFDIVIADELRTILWPGGTDDSDDSWALRARAWQDPHVLIGGSDAGAHLDRMCGSCYPTQFLADCLRGRRLVPVERAVQLMTQAPARLFGLRRRGEVRIGNWADLTLFDPASVDAGAVHRADDLPGGSWRLTAEARGVERVFVNGVEIVSRGVPSGALPGTVLKSGRDTETVML